MSFKIGDRVLYEKSMAGDYKKPRQIYEKVKVLKVFDKLLQVEIPNKFGEIIRKNVNKNRCKKLCGAVR